MSKTRASRRPGSRVGATRLQDTPMNHPTSNGRAAARSGTARPITRQVVPKTHDEQTAVQTEET
ncbi:hypothetical protein [Haladaptatus cibarius]|uniref:hypothetical protein n=1 Tax=Haladaptatus cibarius TaxID=453847 RepID=UPI001184D584|nr:hypothetical protein [Haladaptatus cibarius]